MNVYSDTLTYRDLIDAAPAGVTVPVLEPMPRPRTRRFGYVVGLSGSSPYASQLRTENGTHKAATWDEHGIWMSRLFDIDPEAIIATYKGRDDFLNQTQKAFDGWKERQGAKAPWLS